MYERAGKPRPYGDTVIHLIMQYENNKTNR